MGKARRVRSRLLDGSGSMTKAQGCEGYSKQQLVVLQGRANGRLSISGRVKEWRPE
jgi:hypothetical protein